MRYPVMKLWTWDGTRESYKISGGKTTPFKAQITAYTDVIGFGMYIEFRSNKNLDDYIGCLVHNTPTHKGTTPADLEGFFWCLQLNKLSDIGDNSYLYSLTDLTWGSSDSWSLRESPKSAMGAKSPFISSLTNANPSVTGLFIDGQGAGDNAQNLQNIDDSKTNIFYTGDDLDGVSREKVVDYLQSMNERHSPTLNSAPGFQKHSSSVKSWYLKPLQSWKKQQSYDYMLDEYEVEEIVDNNAPIPITGIRQWAYWRYPDGREDKTKASLYTQYIDEANNFRANYIKQALPQEVFGYPLFFAAANSDGTGTVEGRLPPAKIGSTKFIQLEPEATTYYNFQSALSKMSSFSVQKSFKIYRALDINQHVFYKNSAFVVSEVDYINEISVIGTTTGVI